MLERGDVRAAVERSLRGRAAPGGRAGLKRRHVGSRHSSLSAAGGPDALLNRPVVTLTHALAKVRAADPGSRGSEQTSSALAGWSLSLPVQAGCPLFAATTEHVLTTARASAGNGSVVRPTGRARRAALPSPGHSRCEICAKLCISARPPTPTPASCAASSAGDRERTRSSAPRGSVCSSSPNHPGDVGPNLPKSQRQSGMLGLERHRLVSRQRRDEPESTTTWHRFEGPVNS